MSATGKFILVSGHPGAGKTTMVKALLQAVPSIKYLSNYTTRPPRQGESPEGSFEYQFVSPDQYQQLRSQSSHWDHAEYYGYAYGADIDAQTKLLQDGISLICAIVPDTQTLDRLTQVYPVMPTLIWVDVPLEVANNRILSSGDKGRIDRLNQPIPERINADVVRSHADYIFKPDPDRETANHQFVEFVKNILSN